MRPRGGSPRRSYQLKKKKPNNEKKQANKNKAGIRRRVAIPTKSDKTRRSMQACMCVCVYTYMYVCMYVCMYVSTNECMYE
jgi:hypothetical protein